MKLLTHIARVALSLIACIGLGTANPLSVKVISYDADVTIDSFGGPVRVSLECVMETTGHLSQVQFLFNSATQVQSVRCSMKVGWADVPFSFTGKDTLQVSIPHEASLAGTLRCRFVYEVAGISENDSRFILNRGHRWYPLIVDQIATFRMTVEVPMGCTVLSAGNLVRTVTQSNRSRFEWQSALPVFKLPLIVFRSNVFTETSRSFAGKTVALYALSKDTASTEQVLTEAEGAFTFFEGSIGEYPYDRLTLVETPDFEGINVGSGLLTIGSSSLDGMRKGQFDPLHLTIAQQWIGAGVFAKFGEPGFWFLTISLPHYLRLMYDRQRGGIEAFNKGLLVPFGKYEEFAGKDNDIPILNIDVPNTREKGLVLYAKGPYVLWQLHKHLGDHRWRDFLQSLYREFRGKILTYAEFQNHLLKYDPDGSAPALLDAFLSKKGIPAN